MNFLASYDLYLVASFESYTIMVVVGLKTSSIVATDHWRLNNYLLFEVSLTPRSFLLESNELLYRVGELKVEQVEA